MYVDSCAQRSKNLERYLLNIEYYIFHFKRNHWSKEFSKSIQGFKIAYLTMLLSGLLAPALKKPS